MAQTILYYPNIDIKDGAWLRNAVLYWDEVSSIVPYEKYSDFSSELQYLRELGVYNPIFPQDLFNSEYAEDFSSTIVKRIEVYDRSITKSSNANQNERVRIHKNKIYAPALHELIHYRKLPGDLLRFFEEKKYINDYNAGGWMEIDRKIAQIYMRTLAEYSIKCSSKDIVLGTDTVVSNREIYYSAHNRKSLGTQCCHINIEKCLPQPAKDVSFEDILDFKFRRKDELKAFMEEIKELEKNIYKADSIEEIKHYEARFIERWESCSKDFYKALKADGIAFFLNALVSVVAIPFVSQYLSQHFGPSVDSIIQNGAPLLNIGIDYLSYKNRVSPAKSDGGFSYIFKAKRDGIIYA